MHVEGHHTAAELAELIRAEARGKVTRRLTAVRLALLGHTAAQAAAAALLSERQVRTWVARYNAAGTAGLADAAGRGRKPPLDAAQGVRLAERLRAGPTPADGVCTLRGQDVRRIVREEFGVARGLQAVYDLLHRLGFEPLRPRPRHPSASAEAQAAFKKVPRAHRGGRRGPARRVGRGPVRGRGPLRPAGHADHRLGRQGQPADRTQADGLRQRPRAHRGLPGDRGGRGPGRPAAGHRRGAVAPPPPLGDRRAGHPRGWGDGAGYHSASKALRCPANVTLVTLQPYSPELNPVERLWAYLRQHHWSNRVYADLGAVEAAAAEGWRAVCLKPERIKTVCRCEYLDTGS